MSGYINLNDPEAFLGSANRYGQNAEDNMGEARAQHTKATALHEGGGLRGSAGNRSQMVSGLATMNHTELVKRVAEQAMQVAKSGGTYMEGDLNATDVQNASLSVGEGVQPIVNKPITI